MNVLIVDYGLCNLDSVKRAVEECGGNAYISIDPAELKNASKIILPGVGNFSLAMKKLKEMGWSTALKQATAEKTPLLGICLGMQLLASTGEEGGSSEGLGLIPGKVVSLIPQTTSDRVPHVGWNEVCPTVAHWILKGIDPGKDFYFVHSFHFVPKDSQSILAETPYCGKFASIVGNESTIGVQFHPEKSQESGFKILKNFLDYSC